MHDRLAQLHAALATGDVSMFSPDLLAMAERVTERPPEPPATIEEIEAWAARLAADVANAND